MRIKEIKRDKKRFLPLLLLADDQESMIDRYLERGRMFVLIDDADLAPTPSGNASLTPASEDFTPKLDNKDRALISPNADPVSPRVVAECVVTDEGAGILEIKNIATGPALQGRGYGRALIDFLARRFGGEFKILQVGTGDSPLTVPFYERCGFTRSHRIANFFTDNYDHPIFEAGEQLVDMIYLRRSI